MLLENARTSTSCISQMPSSWVPLDTTHHLLSPCGSQTTHLVTYGLLCIGLTWTRDPFYILLLSPSLSANCCRRFMLSQHLIFCDDSLFRQEHSIRMIWLWILPPLVKSLLGYVHGHATDPHHLVWSLPMHYQKHPLLPTKFHLPGWHGWWGRMASSHWSATTNYLLPPFPFPCHPTRLHLGACDFLPS